MKKVLEYNLQSLKAFLAVRSTGSMTVAATKLGLTQSAVAQAIRQLEDVQLIGHPGRLRMLDRLLEYMRGKPRARFMTCEAVAATVA